MEFIKNSIMTNIFSWVTEQLISIQLISSFLWYFFFFFFYMKYLFSFLIYWNLWCADKDIPQSDALWKPQAADLYLFTKTFKINFSKGIKRGKESKLKEDEDKADWKRQSKDLPNIWIWHLTLQTIIWILLFSASLLLYQHFSLTSVRLLAALGSHNLPDYTCSLAR